MKDLRLKSDRLRFKYINRYLNGHEILDIGSSEGNIHKLLLDKNKDKKIYTLDLKNADYNINLEKPKKINKKFDTVIAGEIIEHLNNPVNFIKYCYSLLTKNGRLILTTPNASGLQYLTNPGWCVNYEDYSGHKQAFTIEMIKRMFTEEKFKLIYTDYINAFWIKNPLKYVSLFIKRLRPDLIVVGDKN